MDVLNIMIGVEERKCKIQRQMEKTNISDL